MHVKDSSEFVDMLYEVSRTAQLSVEFNIFQKLGDVTMDDKAESQAEGHVIEPGRSLAESYPEDLLHLIFLTR